MSILDSIKKADNPYPEVAGALMGYVDMLETELIIARRFKRAISKREVAKILAKCRAVEQALRDTIAERLSQ